MVVLFYLFELVLIVSSVIVLLSKDINIMKKSMKCVIGALIGVGITIILLANMSKSKDDSIKLIENELGQTKLEYTRLLEDYMKLDTKYKELEDTHDECANIIKQKDEEIKQRDEEIKQRDEVIKQRDDKIKQFEKEWIEMNNTIKKLKKK